MLDCPACGHANSPGSDRCARCDNVLRGIGRALATVDSMAPVEVDPTAGGDPALAETGEAPEQPHGGGNRTILGLPSPLAGAEEPKTRQDLPDRALVLAAVEAKEKAKAQDQAQAVGGPMRTVFGMPSPLAAAVDPEEAKKTVFGVPSPLANMVTAESEPAPKVAAPEAASPLPETQDVPRRTVFGMPSPLATGAEPARDVPAAKSPKPRQPAQPRKKRADPEPRTRPMSLSDMQPSREPAAQLLSPIPREPSPSPVPTQTRGGRRSSGDAARDKEAAELYAAARFAAAIAEDEKLYAKARNRNLLLLLLLVSVAAAVAAAFAFKEKARLKAELAGEPKVTRSADTFGVVAVVRVSEPATVRHPGGETRGDGEFTVQFSVPEPEMNVGANTIHLEATAESGGDPQRIPVRIVLYYRFKVPPMTPPKPGTPVLAFVEVGKDWKVAVDGGTATSVDDAGKVQVAIDPTPVLQPDSPGELPIRLALTSPSGETRNFKETVRVPIPEAVLNVTAPPHRWRRAKATAPVRGRTLPGAEVSVGDARATVGADGNFDLDIPLQPGANELVLKVRAPGRKSVSRTFTVERISKRAAKVQKYKLKRLAKAFLKRTKRPPAYPKLLTEADALRGRKVKLKGRLVEVRRSAKSTVDQLQVATCDGEGGCPVWVYLKDGPLMAGQGDTVSVVGTLAGLHSFSRRGDTVEAPRIDSSILIP